MVTLRSASSHWLRAGQPGFSSPQLMMGSIHNLTKNVMVSISR